LLDQRFWMRVAARNDAGTKEERERLTSLANTAMLLVEKMVQATETQLTESGTVVQEILKAGADENGVWHNPLTEDKVEAMQQV
jgi:hypothetical protein